MIQKYEKILKNPHTIIGYGRVDIRPSVVYKGSFGKVVVAVKEVFSRNYFSSDHEIEFLTKLGHINIVRLFHVENQKKSVLIAIEMCDINYEDYLEKKKDEIQIDCITITKNIISGAEYLHKNDIVHGYINPRNVMICIGSRRAKLSDFGFQNFSRQLVIGN